ncbi:hypothetical protein GJ496_004289 [Pomphorhynchus laevis]|nr:hypothetical protein GJ496_004289 [Pomphorhynchus laevis]
MSSTVGNVKSNPMKTKHEFSRAVNHILKGYNGIREFYLIDDDGNMFIRKTPMCHTDNESTIGGSPLSAGKITNDSSHTNDYSSDEITVGEDNLFYHLVQNGQHLCSKTSLGSIQSSVNFFEQNQVITLRLKCRVYVVIIADVMANTGILLDLKNQFDEIYSGLDVADKD